MHLILLFLYGYMLFLTEVSESPKTVTGDDTIVDPSEADSQKPSQKPEELLPVPPPPPAPSAQSEQPPNPPSVGGRKRKARNQASTTGETVKPLVTDIVVFHLCCLKDLLDVEISHFAETLNR